MPIEIQPIGSVLTTDSEGYLVKTARAENFPAHWLPAIHDVIEAYKEHFDAQLHSVYIRGSVASGKAIDNISDLDTIALIDLPQEAIDTSWAGSLADDMATRYPFMQGIEIWAVPLATVAKNRGARILIATQSVCVYGTDVSAQLPRFRPGPDTTQHVGSIEREMAQLRETLQAPHEPAFIRNKCTWMMKRIIRSGFELVMERSGQYTRDLYPCYEGFAKYYPEHAADMRHALELALNPSEDTAVIVSMLDGIGAWLVGEIARVFPSTQA